MESIEMLDLGKNAIVVLLQISLPLRLVALVVGLLISLFQALTQIQEMTLSFVPKIIAIFIAMILFLPFMFGNLQAFTLELFDRIAGS